MVRFKLKKLALAGVLGVQLITVTACKGTSASTDSQTAVVNQETAEEATNQETNTADIGTSDTSDISTNVVYGQVTALNGSDITISVGTLNENAGQPEGRGPEGGNSQDQNGGQPPQQSGDEKGPGTGNSQEKPEAPGGEQSWDQQSGEAPSLLTLTGEKMTITISDESVITSGRPDNSISGLSAVSVGATLAVTYADDGTTITKVEVMGMQQGGGERPGQTLDSAE